MDLALCEENWVDDGGVWDEQVMNSGDELHEDGGEPMLDDPSPTPAGAGRRGPYRRSTLDHMICQVGHVLETSFACIERDMCDIAKLAA
jgi:hypothetical protein